MKKNKKRNIIIIAIVVALLVVFILLPFVKIFPSKISSLCPGDDPMTAVDGWKTCLGTANFWEYINGSNEVIKRVP